MTPSNGRVPVKAHGAILGAVFSSSHALKGSLSPISFCRSPSGTMTAREPRSLKELEEVAMSLHEKILKERAEEGYRRDAHPIVRYYVENGVR